VKNPVSLLLFASRVGRDPIGFQRGRFERYGDIYTSRVNQLVTLVTRHPDHIQQVLVTDGDSYLKPELGIGAAELRRVLGNGLLSSNGDFWRQQRRQVQPAFGAAHLRAYAETMVAYTLERVRQWRQGSVIDVKSEMMGLTLSVVGKVLMGKDVRSQQGEVEAAMVAFRRSFGGVSSVLPRWMPHPARRREERVLARMRALMDGFIDDHASGRGDDDECLLHVLAQGLGSEGFMSREQLRDEALTLFFAGHENTSHALSWTLSLLAQNPEARTKLGLEVAAVLGGRPATFGDLPALEYTGQVLSEGMRLYPPAHTVLREAGRDTTLGGYDVPKGSHVVASIFHAQRDARWHQAPLEFRPERFGGDVAKNLLPGSYVPFGAGTRVCIGKRFALMEATLILATLAQHATLDLVDARGPAANASITLAPVELSMRVGPALASKPLSALAG
jgi:cytochrome P450